MNRSPSPDNGERPDPLKLRSALTSSSRIGSRRAAVPSGPAWRSRRAGWLVVALAAVLTIFHGAWLVNHSDYLEPVTAGDVAPSFALPAVDAKGELVPHAVDSATLRGKVVLVDFWATWCRPCRESLPAVDRVYRRYRSYGFEVLSVNTDNPADGRAMFQSMGLSLPLYFDNGTVSERFQVTSIPHLVLIDQSGVVRHVHRGFESEEEIARQVRALLPPR
ncbi:MAG: TlpA family protein disulfide reductase [Proteobacteria bacterium]|nr:TlpA family protein disulfide reductase [Pseudomonadota bacterium]